MGCRSQYGLNTCSANTALLLFCVLLIQLCNRAIYARPGSSFGDFNLKPWVQTQINTPHNGSGIKKQYYLYNMCSRGYVQLFGPGKRPKAHRKKLNDEKVKQYDYALLRVEGTNFNSRLTIQSQTFHWYLCFNQKGRLIVRHHRGSRKNRKCEFNEIQEADYTEFVSAYNSSWKIGFKKNGKPAKGYFANKKQKCYRFLKEHKKDVPVEPGQGPVQDSTKFSSIIPPSKRISRLLRTQRKHRRRHKT